MAFTAGPPPGVGLTVYAKVNSATPAKGSKRLSVAEAVVPGGRGPLKSFQPKAPVLLMPEVVSNPPLITCARAAFPIRSPARIVKQVIVVIDILMVQPTFDAFAFNARREICFASKLAIIVSPARFS
jgi:hypothetical protein